MVQRSKEIEVLSTIAAIEPHAAFAGFIFCLKHLFYEDNSKYFTKTKTIGQKHYFFKTLSNGYKCNAIERELLKLPAKFGGPGIVNPFKLSDCDYRNSRILMQRKKDPKSS